MLQSEIDELYDYFEEDMEYFDKEGKYIPETAFKFNEEIFLAIVMQDTVSHPYSYEAMARKEMILGECSYRLEIKYFLDSKKMKCLAEANNNAIGRFWTQFYNVFASQTSMENMQKLFPMSEENFAFLIDNAEQQSIVPEEFQ